MPKRYYNLEREAKEYLKACDDKGILNLTDLSVLNSYVINRKINQHNLNFLIKNPVILNNLVFWADASIQESYPHLSSNSLRSLVNSAQFVSLSSGTFGDSIYSGRVHFDGQLGHTTIGRTGTLPSWTSLNLSNNFTISLWLSFNRYGNSFYDFIMSCESYLNNGFRHGLEFGTNKIGFFSGQSGGTLNLKTNYSVILNTPINYTVSYNGQIGRCYINGLYDNQHTGTFNPPSTNISYNYVGGGNKSNTYLYSLKIYNKALTAQEIQQNYIATKSRFGL